MFEKLHHIAYRCRDAQETVDFYTNVIGLKYAAAVLPPEGRKAYGEPCESIHIFFELSDGSYLAFFDVASSPPEQTVTSNPSIVSRRCTMEVRPASSSAKSTWRRRSGRVLTGARAGSPAVPPA